MASPLSPRPRHATSALFLLAATIATPHARAADPTPPPNVVLIFADDLGYADLGCFGAPGNVTPNLDRMAAQGARFTDFHAAQPVCSASRTGLLTGCYPNRVGILGALGPADKIGIADGETTIAEVLKSRGYATAIYGKWHLGHHPRFLPTRHGFDDYFGLPYSNDMWPHHPTRPELFPPLPLFDGEKVVERNPDQHNLTRRYTDHAVQFITAHKDQPFFIYMPHSMPHVPLYVSQPFQNQTGQGLYADVIHEIDASVGEILDTLKKNGLDERTLVMFTSDNGPWLPYGDHAGKTGPLRAGKFTTFEGGHREPFVARWPGRIPAGTVCNEPVMTIDILPTLARLSGASLPAHPIDGKDITPLLTGAPGAKSPHDVLYFYWGAELQAIRSGPWKLHLPHKYKLAEPPGSGGKPGPEVEHRIGLSLFNLDTDLGETVDVAPQHPDIVQRLQDLAEAARGDLGDSATRRTGKGVRPVGRL